MRKINSKKIAIACEIEERQLDINCIETCITISSEDRALIEALIEVVESPFFTREIALEYKEAIKKKLRN